MRKQLFLFLITLLAITSLPQVVLAQSGASVSGSVIDAETKEPLIGATVLVSGTSKGAITDEKGKFTIQGLKRNADISIEVSYLGYQTKTEPIKPTKSSNILTAPLALTPENLTVDAVVVTGKAPIAVQKGDTTQYNADAYKSNPDATAEDLLSKMPGFTVSGGKTTAQGEQITRVYVDGKSYFKNDPAAALSSLPADAIESVQLFDEKSDESKFTGIDDGETIKTINIVTKAKKRNAYFGDYIVGYGTDNHYNIKTNTNLFRDNNRFTLGFGLNDINQSAISGGRFYGGFGRSGLQTASGVKFNYSGEYGKDDRKTDLGFDYIFNHNVTTNSKVLDQSFFPTADYSSRNYSELSDSWSRSNSHSMRLDLESNLGAKHRIIFRPSASLTYSDSRSASEAVNTINGFVANRAITGDTSKLKSYNVSAFLMWMYKMTPKHSFTVMGNTALSRSDNNQFVNSNVTSQNLETTIADSKGNVSTDQNTITLTNNNSVGGRIAYTYAIGKNMGLSASYGLTYNWSESDRKTYVLNPVTGLYEDIDLALSNVFERDYITQQGGLGFSLNQKDKINFSVRANYQVSDLQNNLVFPSSKKYDYVFKSPNANMRLDYYITKNKRLSLRYTGRPELPSVSQLQDVVDNSNPLKVTTGNPNLKQSFNNRIMLTYQASNLEKSTTLRLYAFVTATTGSIANNIKLIAQDTVINGVLVHQGAQLSTPANLSGRWNIFSGVDYAFPLSAIKSTMNTTLNYTYARTPSIYNDVVGYSRSNSGNLNLSLSSNISQNVDFTITSRTGITNARSSSLNTLNNTYISEGAGAKLNVIIWKGLFINGDYSYNFNYYSNNAPADPNYHLLNAGIGYKFLNNKSAEIRLSGYDLLDQSKSLSHTVNDIYIEDSRSSVLKRYFMLSFSYKFNTMKGNQAAKYNSSSSSGSRRSGGMIPPPPGGGGGMGF